MRNRPRHFPEYFALLIIFLVSCADNAVSQEILEFYRAGGERFLKSFPGEITRKDEDTIRVLLGLRLSGLARAKLKLLSSDLVLRDTEQEITRAKAQALEHISDVAAGSSILSGLAALSLGDYYWNRSEETAKFDRAKGYYQAALIASSSLEGQSTYLIGRILDTVRQPTWLKNRGVYGAFGNFIDSSILVQCREQYFQQRSFDKELLSKLSLFGALSMVRELAPLDVVCNQFHLADVGSAAARAEALYELAIYLGDERSCPSAESRMSLIKQLEEKYSSTRFSIKAQELLKKSIVSSWTLSTANVRRAQSAEIFIHGPSGQKADLKIRELGFVLDQELDRRQIAQHNWLGSNRNFIEYFMYPVKSFFSGQVGAGKFNPAQSIPSGAYLVELLQGKERQYLLVSDLLLLASFRGDSLRVQTVSLKTGSAIGEVEIEAHWRYPAGLNSRRKIQRFKSDAAGMLTLPRPRKGCKLTESCDSEELVLIGSKFRHLSFLGVDNQGIYWPFDGDAEYWILLSSDRVAPGDVLSWNLFVRPDFVSKYALAETKSVLHHRIGIPLAQNSYRVDQFGRAAGIVRLGKSWSEGEYALEISVQSPATGNLIQETIPFFVNGHH